MFIAHLPAGYLLSHCLVARLEANPAAQRSLLFAGLFASILPDFDLLYFYLIDQRQHPHHSYWSHIPICWCGLFLLSMLGARLAKSRRGQQLLMVMFANLLLHLLLDTVVGEIRLLYPLSEHYFVLFDVPAQHDWWVLNFVLHWSFALELLICVVALWLYSGRVGKGALLKQPLP